MKHLRRKRSIALLAAGSLFVFYHAAFFPYVLEATLRGAVSRFTEASLDLRVRRAGLVFGFVFENVALRDRKDNSPIFTADRLNLKFAFHSLLIGHLGVREVGLYNAKIYLTEKDGRWNYHALTGPPGPTAPPKPVPPSGPPAESISVFVPIKLYANLVLEKVSLHYSSGAGAKRTGLDLENVNFRLALITRTFRSIPLNANIIELCDTLVVGLNPHSPLRLRFDGQPGVQGDLGLTYLLYKDEGTAGSEFMTKLHIDTSKLKIGPRGRVFLPVGFSVDYDTVYQSREDRLVIRDLSLRHHSAVWLSLAARIDRAVTPQRQLSLEVRSSQIRLGPLYQLLSVATGGRVPFFTGTVELAPLKMEGTLQDLKMSGVIRGSGIVYGAAGMPESRIPVLFASFRSGLDLYRVLPFLQRPPGYDAERPLAFGLFHALDVDRFNVAYNGALIGGSFAVRPAGLRAQMQLAHFRIDDWGYGYAWGFLDGNCSYSSNIRFTSMKFSCRTQASELRYALGRSRSGRNLVQMDFDGSWTKAGGANRTHLSRLDLRMRDEDENPTFSMRGAIDMRFGGGQFYDIRADEMVLHYEKLRGTLPGSLQHSLQSSEFYLQKSPVLRMHTVAKVVRGVTDVKSTATARLGFSGGVDLTWDADASFGPSKMDFRRFTVAGLGGLRLETTGALVKRADGQWDPDLVVRLNLQAPRPLELYPNVLVSGDAVLETDVHGGRAVGKMSLIGMNVEQRSGSCGRPESAECVRYRVDGINLNLPIDHHLRLKNPPRLTDGSEYYLSRAGSVSRPNLTVRLVSASHNPRGEYTRASYFYVGAVGAGIPDGMRARLSYRNNVLQIDGLEIHSYRPVVTAGQLSWKPQGVVFGERIFFNAADLKPESMEYGAFVQIKDLDLEPFLPKSRTGYDGIISADLEVIASRLSDPLLNTNVRLSVYRLSPEFSGFVTRLVMPGPIAEGIVNRTLEIPSIKVQLAGGLVYSTIGIKREALGLGLFVRPGSDEIKQERIPLAQFLANARSEARR